MDLSFLISGLIGALAGGTVPGILFWKSNKMKNEFEAKILELTANSNEVTGKREEAEVKRDIQKIVDERLEMYERNRVTMIEMLESSHKEVIGQKLLVNSLREQLVDREDKLQFEKKEKFKLMNELTEIKKNVAENKRKIDLMLQWTCLEPTCKKRKIHAN